MADDRVSVSGDVVGRCEKGTITGMHEGMQETIAKIIILQIPMTERGNY